jgi:very-short-patch-repair endonuclease
MHIYYNSKLIPRARNMRKEMTPAEKHLWFNCLLNAPYKFRRQRPIGNFVVDFYCAELKLVIEVDGDSHFSEQGLAYDQERTQFLESRGLCVLRFTNDEVLYQTEAVKEKICGECDPSVSLRETPPL